MLTKSQRHNLWASRCNWDQVVIYSLMYLYFRNAWRGGDTWPRPCLILDRTPIETYVSSVVKAIAQSLQPNHSPPFTIFFFFLAVLWSQPHAGDFQSKHTSPIFMIVGRRTVYTRSCHGNVMCRQYTLDLLQSPKQHAIPADGDDHHRSRREHRARYWLAQCRLADVPYSHLLQR